MSTTPTSALGTPAAPPAVNTGGLLQRSDAITPGSIGIAATPSSLSSAAQAAPPQNGGVLATLSRLFSAYCCCCCCQSPPDASTPTAATPTASTGGGAPGAGVSIAPEGATNGAQRSIAPTTNAPVSAPAADLSGHSDVAAVTAHDGTGGGDDDRTTDDGSHSPTASAGQRSVDSNMTYVEPPAGIAAGGNAAPQDGTGDADGIDLALDGDKAKPPSPSDG